MWSIREFAQQVGISPRAVRFRIKEGSLPARKIGQSWVIEGDPGERSVRRPGRKLSTASFDHLAAYLDGDDGDLTSDQRRRAAERGRRMRRLGVEQVREFAIRPDLTVEQYRASADDLAELRSDRRLTYTGVSHEDAEVYGPVIDAYVSRSDCDDIALFHMLEPVRRAEANVALRVQDPPPQIHRLHVIADLLDDGAPRSTIEAERLMSGLLQAQR